MYRDSTPPDVVNRAATQQQSEQMAAQRVRTDTYRSCYVQRGYQEFKLTPEQRSHLGTLKSGSNEYLQYLADIGTDPKLLKSPADQ
jgi:Spy/CpxP family protein refolding chaperone